MPRPRSAASTAIFESSNTPSAAWDERRAADDAVFRACDEHVASRLDNRAERVTERMAISEFQREKLADARQVQALECLRLLIRSDRSDGDRSISHLDRVAQHVQVGVDFALPQPRARHLPRLRRDCPRETIRRREGPITTNARSHAPNTALALFAVLAAIDIAGPLLPVSEGDVAFGVMAAVLLAIAAYGVDAGPGWRYWMGIRAGRHGGTQRRDRHRRGGRQLIKVAAALAVVVAVALLVVLLKARSAAAATAG